MPRLQEQERAVKALETIKGFAAKPNASEYRQLFQQLPSRILASGLGQALAFSASKSGKEEEVAACVARFLLGRPARTVDLLEQIMQESTTEYRVRTRQALAYAEWLKRFAAALMPKEKE